MNEALEQLLGLGSRGQVEVLFLIVLRLIPLVTATPLFGGEAVPTQFRIGLALVIALALRPLGGGAEPVLEGPLLAHAAKEIAIGAVLAVLVRTVFELAASVGAVIDVGRGAAMAQMLDPSSRQQRSVLGVFILQVAIALYFEIGGHEQLMIGLHRNLELMPVESLSFANTLVEGAKERLATIAAEFLTLAFRLAAPVLLVIFLLDLILAQMGRAAQQLHPYFLGLVVKGTLGILMAALVMHRLLPEMMGAIGAAMARILGV